MDFVRTPRMCIAKFAGLDNAKRGSFVVVVDEQDMQGELEESMPEALRWPNDTARELVVDLAVLLLRTPSDAEPT